MRNQSNEQTPVGVVPRRQVESIEPLMSDAPDTCTVSVDVEAPPERGSGSLSWSQWVTPSAAVGIVAATLEWLKLTR